jgi:MHS family alpha-ketoglutarate permease-like MFS transporter
MTQSDSSRTASTPIDYADMRRRLKAIFIGSAGNLVEWYDFYAYAAFSLYFAGSFFPKDDPVAQQIAAAAIFAIGFIMRPIGGWLFGAIADRRGRKFSLTLSVLLMCFGSLVIAVTPTYASIGILAPIILTLARLIQGLSLGGEYGASATYLSEMADPNRRGFYSSFQYVTLIGGQLTAIVVLLILQNFVLTPDQLKAWGWRIPFFIGAVLAVVAFIMRANMHETDHFTEAKKSEPGKVMGSLRALFQHPKEVLLVVGLTAGGTTAFYTYTTTMQKILKFNAKLGLTDQQITYVVFGSLLFAVFLQPLFGALSDKVGRRPLLLWFGVMGTLCTIPMLTMLESVTNPWIALLIICAAWMIVAGYTSINAVVKAELFPTNVRALGVGLPYALTVALLGGSADFVALSFKEAGHAEWFYWYLTGLIFLSLIVYATMRDTKHDSAMDRHR